MSNNNAPFIALGGALFLLVAGGLGAYLFLSPEPASYAPRSVPPAPAIDERENVTDRAVLESHAALTGEPFGHASVSAQGHIATFSPEGALRLTWPDITAPHSLLEIPANVSTWADGTLVALTPGLNPAMHVVRCGDEAVTQHTEIPLAGQPKDVLVNTTGTRIWALIHIDNTTHLQSFDLETLAPTPIVDTPIGALPVGFYSRAFATWIPVFGEPAAVFAFDNMKDEAPVAYPVDMLPYVATGDGERTWVAAANAPVVNRVDANEHVEAFSTPAPLSTLVYLGRDLLLGASNESGDLFQFDADMNVTAQHSDFGVVTDTAPWMDLTFLVLSGQTPQLIALNHWDLSILEVIQLEGQPTAVQTHRLPGDDVVGVSVMMPESGRVETWTIALP